jgi:hypothetical protein
LGCSDLTTAGSVGKRFIDFVTTLVYAAPDNAGITAIHSKVDDVTSGFDALYTMIDGHTTRFTSLDNQVDHVHSGLNTVTLTVDNIHDTDLPALKTVADAAQRWTHSTISIRRLM